MKYFTLNMTAEQAESRFRDLTKAYHPDTSHSVNDGSEFIELKSEYEDWKAIQRHLTWLKKELGKAEKEIVVKQVQVPVYIPPPAPTIAPIDINSIISQGLEIIKETSSAIKEGQKLYRQISRKRRAKKQ